MSPPSPGIDSSWPPEAAPPQTTDEAFSSMLAASLDSSGKKSLHARLAWLGFVLALVAAVVIGTMVYRRLVAAEEEQVRSTLAHISESRADAVSAWIRERLADATALSNGKLLGDTMSNWIVQGGINLQAARQVREQLNSIKQTYGYLEAAITDVNGNIRLSGTPPPERLDAFARQTIARADYEEVPVFSGIHAAWNANRPVQVVDIAAPLLELGQAQATTSVLYLRANADESLVPFVQSFPLLNTASAVLLAEIRDNRVVATLTDRNMTGFGFLEEIPVRPALLLQAAQGKPIQFFVNNALGTGFLCVARKIDGVPWYLITLVDANAARASLHRIAWIVLATCSGALLLCSLALLSWLRGKRSEQQYQALRHVTEKQLLQRRYDYLSKYANDMIILADSANRIVEANDRALQLLGNERETLVGVDLSTLFMSSSSRQQLEVHLRALGKTGAAMFELEKPDGAGGNIQVEVSARLIRTNGEHFIQLICRDISERKAAEQQVRVLAYYDNVTGLPNRRLLQDRLSQAMQMAARSRKKVALLFMDLDNFKNINDSLGHHIGDLLLRDIAHRLLQCVRGEDTVARIGGDEFLVVLPDLEKSGQAVPVAEKILASTALPGVLDGQQIHTTISIGISVYPDDGRDPNELIRHADTALYQAKSHGRDNYQFFTRELNDQITRSSSIERQLRAAVDNNQLSLWYQPQIDTRSGRLIGAEALLRWRRADGTFLSPVEFIPVAEERGLIGRIGEWAMREACAQCRRWQEQGLPIVPVAVNVSPIQFQQKSFASLVTGILAETGLDATMLELEITESAIMRRAPQVAELASRLREIGVGISIDDFGTGYSSLSYLKQIPIDKIKIDRSFIADMLDDDDDNAITFAIVNLAHSLNLRVIAEGVETKAQIDRLRLFGCDEVQGHYYSSAVSAEIFATMLMPGGEFPVREAAPA